MTPKNNDSLFNKANKEWDAGNTKQAFKLFSMAAEQGHLASLNSLAYFYDLGIGVSKNKRKALQLYKRAARRGDECSMSNIGTVYRDMGNFRRAQYWLLKAFKSRDGDAALELAKLYLKRNAKGDIVRASKYLRLAVNYNPKFITEASVEEATLVLSLLNSTDPSVISETIDSLRYNDYNAHWLHIEPFLRHESPKVMGAALRYAHYVLPPGKAFMFLKDALQNSDSIVCQNALDGLGEFGDKRGLALIKGNQGARSKSKKSKRKNQRGRSNLKT